MLIQYKKKADTVAFTCLTLTPCTEKMYDIMKNTFPGLLVTPTCEPKDLFKIVTTTVSNTLTTHASKFDDDLDSSKSHDFASMDPSVITIQAIRRVPVIPNVSAKIQYLSQDYLEKLAKHLQDPNNWKAEKTVLKISPKLIGEGRESYVVRLRD